MKTNQTKLAEISHLDYGSHHDPEGGLCLLEAVAYFAGEPHTDHPKCVSPILGQFGRSLNDALPDDLRQQLIPLIPELPGTADDGLDEARGYLALDWLIRVYTPAWLELAGLTEQAAELRSLGQIGNLAAAKQARPVVLTIQGDAYDSWVNVRASAAAADRAAARAAARAADQTTAKAIALEAARVAAVAVEWAGNKSAPTETKLQRSAIELYRSMIRPVAKP